MQGWPDLALVTVLLWAGDWTRDLQRSLPANVSITAAMLCLHPELPHNFAVKKWPVYSSIYCSCKVWSASSSPSQRFRFSIFSLQLTPPLNKWRVGSEPPSPPTAHHAFLQPVLVGCWPSFTGHRPQKTLHFECLSLSRSPWSLHLLPTASGKKPRMVNPLGSWWTYHSARAQHRSNAAKSLWKGKVWWTLQRASLDF